MGRPGGLVSVSIRDIMFPGPLKEMLAQVIGARQEGLAAQTTAAEKIAPVDSHGGFPRDTISNKDVADFWAGARKGEPCRVLFR